MHITEKCDPKVRIQSNKVRDKVEITKRGLILSSFLKMKIDVGCEVSLIFKASSVKIL